MKPTYHLIVSMLLTIALYPFYGPYSLLAMLGGFLIDTDHYIFYVVKKRDFSIRRMYNYCMDSTYNEIFCIFHNIEFFALILLLSLLAPIFFIMLLSMFIHFIMDFINLHQKGRLKKDIKAFSLIARSYTSFRPSNRKREDEEGERVYTKEDMLDHDGIAAIIKNEKGEVLMQNHVKYGFWTIPVGKVKTSQNAAKALKEELFEECGIRVRKYKEILSKEYIYVRRGKRIKVRIYLFLVSEYSGRIKNMEPHKHRKQEFISIENIKKLPYLSDATLLYLETLGFRRKARI